MSFPTPATRTSRRGFLGVAAAAAGVAALTPFVGAVDPAQAATPNAAVPKLVGDGVTDDGPALQRIYDAGGQAAFVSGRTYLINTPVFFDKAGVTEMYVLDLNGATLRLGAKLPTTAAFWRDTKTKWAFFPNTKRSALSGGTVNVSVATRASGPYVGSLIALVVRNGTVEGDGANAALVFANRTGIRFESVVLRRGRALLSWFDYCDVNVLVQCHNRAGGPAESVLVEQVASGDGLLIQSCKSDASVGVARLKYCRGAEITGTVTGRIELDACSAVIIRGGHQETPLSNTTIVDIKSSSVVIDTTALYLSRGEPGTALPPAIRVRDYGSVASVVVLRDCVEMRALLSTDQQLGPLISVEQPLAGTRVESRGLSTVVSASGIGGVWNASPGPVIEGTAAITSAARTARPILATGDFLLVNPGAGWTVRSTTPAVVAGSTAPTLKVEATTAFSGGLGTASRRYRVQGRSVDGTFTAASGLSAAVSGPKGALKLLLNPQGAPQAVRVWRYRGSTTTAEAYLEIPATTGPLVLYDTGRTLNGFPWAAGDSAFPRSVEEGLTAPLDSL